jgi:hypothetical protein
VLYAHRQLVLAVSAGTIRWPERFPRQEKALVFCRLVYYSTPIDAREGHRAVQYRDRKPYLMSDE